MESPLLRHEQTSKRKAVAGSHQTSDFALFNVVKVYPNAIHACFGDQLENAVTLNARDLREFAELFTEIANTIEGK